MSESQPYQTMPYQGAPVAYMPYMQPPAAPQSDPIDQIAKVAKLLDYLQNKNGTGQNTALQTGQPAQVGQYGNTSQNVAQFQAQSQAALDAQQIASGIGVQQQGQASLQPNPVATYRNLQNVSRYATGLEQELNQAYQVIKNLLPLSKMTQILLRENEQQNAVIQSLKPFVATTLIYQGENKQMESAIRGLAPLARCLIPMMRESEQAYQTATNLVHILRDPGFLLIWTFNLLKQSNLTEFDLNLVSELFLELCDLKDPTPQYSQNRIQANYRQVPFPIPGNNQNVGREQGTMAILEILRNSQSPQTATTLQRMRVAGVI